MQATRTPVSQAWEGLGTDVQSADVRHLAHILSAHLAAFVSLKSAVSGLTF